MSYRQVVTIDAPAKINLGLEILGKRADGFHEIRSVMVMLQLADTLRVYTGGAITGTELPYIQADTNLIALALAAFRQAVPGSPELGWAVDKRIPVAAGLGGASADAAAALIAANELSGNPLSWEELTDVGGTLGSDVAFFFGTPAAYASGRGTDLEPLPALDTPVTLLVPATRIDQKTRTLYSMIGPDDLTDGSRAARVRRAVEHLSIPELADLANAFRRPMSCLVPTIAGLETALVDNGIDHFGLSGAGPTLYVIGTDACEILASLDSAECGLESLTIIPTRTRLDPVTVRSMIRNA